MIFQINFNVTVLKRNEYFTAFVHELDTADLLDSGQTRMWMRVYKKLGFAEESVSLSYSTVKTARLPHPYDTACVKMTNGQSKTSVEFDCINNLTLAHMNRAMFATINTNQSSTAGIITVEHLRNPSIASRLKKFQRKCQLKFDACDLSFTYSKAYLIPNPDLAVSLYVPSDPIIQIDHVARMILVEFLIYLCSSFGSWFGLSIFAFLLSSSRVGIRLLSRAVKVHPIKEGNQSKGIFTLIKATSYETDRKSLGPRDVIIMNEVLEYLNRFSNELRNDLENNLKVGKKRILQEGKRTETSSSLRKNEGLLLLSRNNQ
jgi:hypothetical protein